MSFEQHSLVFARLELQECQKVISLIKIMDQREQANHDLKHWLKEEKRLMDKVFELQILQGIDCDVECEE